MNPEFLTLIAFDTDHPAILAPGENLSYRELKKGSDHYAAFFRKSGIKKGMHVSVLGNNNASFIKALLALWKLNSIPVLLNSRLLDHELEDLIRHSASKAVIIDEEFSDRLIGINTRRIVYPFNWQENSPLIPPGNSDDPERALILYTSGTTGKPKGVVLTFDNLLQSALASDTLIRHSAADRWLASLPFYHIGGFSIIIRALLFGATIIIPESLKTPSITAALDRYNPTLASFVSTTLERLIEAGVSPPSGLRYLLLGGGPVSGDLSKKSIEAGWKTVNVYGSSETSSMVTALPYYEAEGRNESAGKPLGTNEISIRGFDSGNVLPNGKEGEITIKSGSVFREYWKNSKETNSRLKDEWYYSGDIGYLDNDNYLYVVARRTDLIITGGENVNPMEVERAILEFPGIREACVFPFTSREWGQVVAAALVTDVKPEAEKLKVFLGERIAHFKVPREIFFVGHLPRTPLGKVKRDEVRRLFDKW